MEMKNQIKKVGLFILYFLIILVTIVGAMANFVKAENWTMFQYDLANTGYTTNTIVTNISVLANSYNFGINYLVKEPIISGNFVYVAQNDTLYQFDLNLNFVSSYGVGDVINSPVVANGYVYFMTLNGEFYQLDANNVSNFILKNAPNGGKFYSSPKITEDYIYIGGTNCFFQLDANNISNVIAHFMVIGGGVGVSIYGSPAITNDYAYIGSENGCVYQLDKNNVSNLIATYNTTEVLRSSPSVANGYVYIGGYTGGKVYQLDVNNVSNLIASYDTNETTLYTTSVNEDYVYIGGWFEADTLFQLDANNVSNSIATYNIDVKSSSAITDDYVYIGSATNGDYKVYQLNASDISNLIFTYTTNNKILSSPSVANGYLYIGNSDGFLYQLGEGIIDTTPPSVSFIIPSENNKTKFYSNELNNVKINFYDLNLKNYFIEFIYWENYLNQTIEFSYNNTNITETFYNFSEIFYTLKEGKWKLNVTSQDNRNNTNAKIVNFEVIELKEGYSIFDFDLTNQVNVILLFVMLFAYIGLMAIAFSFKNFGFASIGFIVGIFVGFLLSGIHIILTLLFILINILIFAKYASSFD